MSDVNDFLKQYSVVFDDDGSVTNCGRKACIELIMLARRIDKTRRFGDEFTGFMNIDEISDLKKSCKL